MTSEECVQRLELTLTRDAAGRYHFACLKAMVSIRLRGASCCKRFAAKDRVVFRADAYSLTVEQLGTGVIRSQFSWEQIESLAAGEPETDSGSLFQG